MNVNGDDQYTVPNCSTSAIDLGNQTLPNGNQVDLELGFFALGAEDDQYQEFTLGGTTAETYAVNAWVMPGYFYNKSITESYSFSLHIGSTAFNYPGSMLFGGYDKGRAIGPATTYADTKPPLQDIVLGVETGGSPWDFDSKDNLLLTNTSSHDSITVTPEPMVPYLHLPKQTCDNLAKYLPVSKDSSGYYLWNTADPTYKNITTSAAYLGFVFPPATGGTQDVTIKVPFQLLVLNLTVEASGYAGQTPYFPCMPYEPSDGNYLLGRAFLQSAFLGRNWNRHISWLAQAPGPGASRTGLGVQPTDIDDGDTSLDFFPDNGRFAASWSDHWTPLEGSTTNGDASSGGGSGDGGDDGGLSTGATAGIGVGAAALAVGVLGVAAFFLVRRRKQRKSSESEQQPFTAAHYGDEAKASPAPHERPQVDQYGQAFNEHQQQYNQQHYGHYEPYKARPPPQQESIPLSELSGTMRNPAQELPAHEPMELEAPYKTNDPEFLDIVLSRTQRRLPTQIRAGFKITRIRAFYIRKVKYTSETFAEKLSAILHGFPRLADIHPFHKDLLNTLYDADHFRIALGQLNTAKGLIETVSRDYIRLLKYGQSLFQCKQLKRAALGRMATICKRLKDPLLYLEQVRQHLGRLPSIDPNTRTLLICGYPNVGKSSFLKNISRADVDIQPYAFTTKSLFVGHFDYKMLRFQAIDTPGILDHPLEEMNTIEMQSITAIAHLRSAILYFMDLSEQCGYSVQAQMALFQSIKPLFANKLVFIVINKIDVTRPEDLDPETQEKLQELLKSGNVELLQLSCTTSEGLMNVRNAACDRLLAERNAQKLKSGTNASGEVTGRLGDVLRRIHVAQPLGGIVRESYIPEAALKKIRFDKDDPNRPKLMRDIEEENGGAGVFNINLKDQYLLENDEWKNDKVPEYYLGRNVADYVDPEIDAKLAALEDEEARLEAEGFYNGEEEEELEDAEDADVRFKADLIREKRQLIRNENKMRKSLKNRAVIPRSKKTIDLNKMEQGLDKAGYDTSALSARARSQSRPRGRAAPSADGDAMDIDPTPRERLSRSISVARSRSQSAVNRREDGVTDEKSRTKAERLAKLGQKKMNRMARQGEADRHTTASLPKWLLAGKRGMGSTRSR
ncbi:Nucleolar GTP-binding protein 1 [Vermiconidia calcicola]|uniref:Nucleolar GTP-binding protein 1 n=1 Tax=Vermiconidia calcicola TaxID=1690605 RepID=A0ACC3M9N4_9PEZI|nr:Nucleolar GTP-binding protein 1 [Vermiconidia calcicola]